MYLLVVRFGTFVQIVVVACYASLEVVAFTLVVAQDVLSPEVDAMHLVDRVGIVQLENMFVRA